MEELELNESELENFYKRIGENVKKQRDLKGLSQLQLAQVIGHNSPGHIAKAEVHSYGKRFNLEQLYKISRALEIDIALLFE